MLFEINVGDTICFKEMIYYLMVLFINNKSKMHLGKFVRSEGCY